MMFRIDVIDTTPGRPPGACLPGTDLVPCPAFVPPETIATRNAYARWLMARCLDDLSVAQAVHLVQWWCKTQWSRPLTVSGPFADAFPRIIDWLIQGMAEHAPQRRAELKVRLASMPSEDEASPSSTMDDSDRLAYHDEEGLV